MKKTIIKIIKNIGALITAMAGVLVIIYFAFFGAVMNDSFLADVNLEIGIHEKLEMSEEDLIAVAESMVYYTKGEVDTLQVRVTMGGVERDFYNERELLHIEDVRDLVREVRIFIIGCGVVFVIGTVVHRMVFQQMGRYGEIRYITGNNWKIEAMRGGLSA